MHKQKFRDLKQRLNFATSLNNAKYYRANDFGGDKTISELNDISQGDGD